MVARLAVKVEMDEGVQEGVGVREVSFLQSKGHVPAESVIIQWPLLRKETRGAYLPAGKEKMKEARGGVCQ